MSDPDRDTPDLARLTAVQDALHKVQEQAAAFEELGERLSLSVHMLEAEVAGLARELRARAQTAAVAAPSEAASQFPGASSSASAGARVVRDSLATNGEVQTPAPERSADLDGARLVALNMALAGEARQDVDRYIAEHFALPDRERLLDEVWAAVGSGQT